MSADGLELLLAVPFALAACLRLFRRRPCRAWEPTGADIVMALRRLQ